MLVMCFFAIPRVTRVTCLEQVDTLWGICTGLKQQLLASCDT